MKALRDIRGKRRGKVFRSLISLLTVVIFILTSVGFVLSDDSPSIGQYTAYPPFGGTIVKPNVLINLDTSTSLNYFAYDFNYNVWEAPTGKMSGPKPPAPSTGYNPNKTYYGYFDSDKDYSYSGGEFIGNGGPWNGNFLNWLTMRRSDLLKKALVGGKTKLRAGIVPATNAHAQDLVGEAPYIYTKYVGYQKKVSNAVAKANTPYTGTAAYVKFTFDNDEGGSTIMGGQASTKKSIPAFSFGSAYKANNNFNVIVHRSLEDGAPKGVIQRVGNSVRWGLEFIDDGGAKAAILDNSMGPGMMMGNGRDETSGGWSMMGGNGMMNSGPIHNVQGGTIEVPVGYNKVDEIVSDIATMKPSTPATPLAESLWTATGYFAQDTTTGNTGPRYTANSTPFGSYKVSNTWDPYNYALDRVTDSPKPVGCGDSFVITITDGEPTQDRSVPNPPKGFNPTYADGTSPVPDWQTKAYFWLDKLQGSHYIDDVALWSHVNPDNSYRDLRPKLSKEQYLTNYFIYTNFGDGTPDARRLLNWPDSSNTAPYINNLSPNAGGAARNGGFIESGTNYLPDVTSEYDSNPKDGSNDNFFEASTGDELETALLKALYNILAQTASGTAPAFAGSRGASNGMIYQASFFPEREFDVAGVKVKRQWLGYLKASEVDADGTVTTPPLWEAGEKLWERVSPRIIYTTTDNKSLLGFSAVNASGLKDYLRAKDNTEAKNIINWIRGDDLSGVTDSGHTDGYRSRKVTIGSTENTWKLGDIVYSSPTPVGTPEENNDRRYKDISYTSFYRKYINRRNVVYVGANDGMLHAFNGGFYCYDKSTTKAKYTYATARDKNGNCIAGGTALGEELWGFIPQQLLPHLKWLTNPNYTHVYYVDLKPKVTDVQIFTPDTDHPKGWGTILIGGMRLGGKQISAVIDGKKETFYSAYFALDITNPEKPPKLLWTFTDLDSNSDGVPDRGLGLTTSYPAVARVKISDADDLWVMIVGSGPTDFDAGSNVSSNQTGKVFVVDLKTGNLLKSFDTGDTNAFMTDPIAVDVNLDYKVDVAYIGEAYYTGTGYNKFNKFRGKIYRLVTENSRDVSNDWKLSTLMSLSGNKPVTSAPSAALDGKGNMWVFFGTGKFIGSDDLLTSDAQAFYGIKDICKPWQGDYTCTDTDTVSDPDDLYDASAIVVTEGDETEWSDILAQANAKNGWVINFPRSGERAFAKPVVLGGLVIFTSYIPTTDICDKNDQGTGYLWAVYYETGTAYKHYVFTAETAGKPATVGREQKLGKGFAGVSAMVTRGGSLKAFAQTSVGAEIPIETKTPFGLKSGIAGWKTGECRQ